MSTKSISPNSLQPLGLRDLAVLLVKHYGLTEGKFEISIEYQMGSGSFGPSPDRLVPSVAIGVSRIGLVPSTADTPFTVDAAELATEQ